jgi:hypothetical protein
MSVLISVCSHIKNNSIIMCYSRVSASKMCTLRISFVMIFISYNYKSLTEIAEKVITR